MNLKKSIAPGIAAAFVLGSVMVALTYGLGASSLEAAANTIASPQTLPAPLMQSRGTAQPLNALSQRDGGQTSVRPPAPIAVSDEVFEAIPEELDYTPDLRPRRTLPKRGNAELAAMPPTATGVLNVKFKDEVRARFHPERGAVSRAGRDLRAFENMVRNHDLTVKPAFYRSEAELRSVEKRAELFSGVAQPDLAGMMDITGPPERLVQAAQWLNAQDFVEWVEFELETFIGDDPQGCGPPADNERPPGDCFDHLDVPAPYCLNDDCCAAVCEIDAFCCDDTIVWPGRACPGFAGPNGHWDINCVQLALQLGAPNCTGGPPPPEPLQCFLPINNPCGIPGQSGGCLQSGCCQNVCEVLPHCCSAQWDSQCVAMSLQLCAFFDASALTPDFQHLQGHLTPEPYDDDQLTIFLDHGIIPIYTDCLGIQGPLPGWNGMGYDLPGLTALGEFHLDPGNFGLGQDPGAPPETLVKGKTIRIGIIEHTALVFPGNLLDEDGLDANGLIRHHEGLRHVISEPGQSPLLVPFSVTPELTGHHGTASLGVVGARPIVHDPGDPNADPPVPPMVGGMIGIAPEAEIYFFPTVTFQEGGRLGRALLSAIEAFDPGDVFSLSIGLGPGGTIANAQRNWTLFRLATDSGITVVISAGNNCLNLDSPPVAAQFECQDSGVIVVGAGYPGCGPGNCYCRLGFSNYCSECPEEGTLAGGESCRVHVQAWGTAVPTTGYGDLFMGTNTGEYFNVYDMSDGGTPFRSYTLAYGGTSAAAPQVAGLVARLQGLAKQAYGIPLHPIQMRGVVSGDASLPGHWWQCLIPPELGDPPGGGENACIGDHDLDAQPRRIGSYTHAQLAGQTVLSGGWFDCDGDECFACDELWDAVHTIRGTYLWGNTFSICINDGNFYRARSEGTTANSKPSFMPPGLEHPLSKVNYRSTGQVADVLAVGRIDDPHLVTSFGITTVSTAALPTLRHIEIYDWISQRWVWGSTSFVPLGPAFDATFPFVTANPQRFFNDEGTFLVRVWAFGFGAVPSGGTFGQQSSVVFDFLVDMINVDIVKLGDGPED